MKNIAYFKNNLKKLPVVQVVYFTFLKLFNINKIVGMGKIIKQNALLLNSHIVFAGHGNVISIAPKARIENYRIKIYGSNNKISIGENCQMKNGELWIEDDNNELIIGARVLPYRKILNWLPSKDAKLLSEKIACFRVTL